MGMYDYINGEQIKCFYNIIYSSNCIGKENIWHSGGNLSGFSTGKEVPYKTVYYNYGKDFIIFDHYETIAHYVKNGRIEKTVYKDLIEEKLSDIPFS